MESVSKLVVPVILLIAELIINIAIPSTSDVMAVSLRIGAGLGSAAQLFCDFQIVDVKEFALIGLHFESLAKFTAPNSECVIAASISCRGPSDSSDAGST